ncbi:unnamed protein product [Danaus chrysippus]|uniref:(African queen) hypothetical protein n=1 Tax=Danaus chrysippus TaxID=151541 RepID=A0A8J2QMB7_9NEOP|nr:unnamed protein product [Danaus chrysippus]
MHFSRPSLRALVSVQPSLSLQGSPRAPRRPSRSVRSHHSEEVYGVWSATALHSVMRRALERKLMKRRWSARGPPRERSVGRSGAPTANIRDVPIRCRPDR